jgi:hypothetical protein
VLLAAWDVSGDNLHRLAYREARGHMRVFLHFRIYNIICGFGENRAYVSLVSEIRVKLLDSTAASQIVLEKRRSSYAARARARGHTYVFLHFRIYVIICNFGENRPYVAGNRA